VLSSNKNYSEHDVHVTNEQNVTNAHKNTFYTYALESTDSGDVDHTALIMHQNERYVLELAQIQKQ